MSKYSIKRKIHRDGWGNALTGLGRKNYDKTEHFQYQAELNLSPEELANIFDADGVGTKIVSKPAEDSTRRWFTLDGDTKNKIFDEQKRLGLQHSVAEAITWARLYGGSVIVMDINDGGSPEEELNPRRVVGIRKLRVYDRTRVDIDLDSFISDPSNPHSEEPEILTIQKMNGESYRIHISRCLIFKGKKTATRNQGFSNWYWGSSIMQHVYASLSYYGGTQKGIAGLMQEFSLSLFKIRNLSDIIAGDDEEIKQLYDRMDIIQASKSTINGILLDAEMEDYSRDTVSLSGVDAIIDRFQMGVSAVAEIPVDILFGRSPAGMNATGEFSLRSYYDNISAYQNNNLSHTIMPILDIIGIYLNEKSGVEINWLSLFEPTAKEKAEVRKLQMEVDLGYYNMGVLSPQNIRAMRWNNGIYTDDMTLSETTLPEDGFTPEELAQIDGANK